MPKNAHRGSPRPAGPNLGASVVGWRPGGGADAPLPGRRQPDARRRTPHLSDPGALARRALRLLPRGARHAAERPPVDRGRSASRGRRQAGRGSSAPVRARGGGGGRGRRREPDARDRRRDPRPRTVRRDHPVDAAARPVEVAQARSSPPRRGELRDPHDPRRGRARTRGSHAPVATGSLGRSVAWETDSILTRRRRHVDIPQERKVVTEIPGPRSREWFERRAAAVPQGVFNTHPIVTARASGAIIEDVDGNRLIDFATGIAVLNLGHTVPEVVAAAQRQLELDTHTCFHVTANEPYIELAERLNALAPGDHEKKTMFANSGAEAVENAVKIARKATGRDAIVTFDHAFHGRTLLAMSLTAKVMPYKQGMGPFAPEIYRLPFAYPYRCPTGGSQETCAESCLAYAIDEMHKHIGEENIAAILIEPIQGEGGFIVPAPGFIPGPAEFA